MVNFNKLVELYTQGGILVCTPDPDFRFQTLIQPDGDFVTFAAEDALQDAQLWHAHYQALRVNVRFIHTLRWIVRASWWLGWVPMLWGGYSLIQAAYGEVVQAFLWMACYWVARSITKDLLRWYIKWQMDMTLKNFSTRKIQNP